MAKKEKAPQKIWLDRHCGPDELCQIALVTIVNKGKLRF